jgi:Flp pilus assembly protein TadD
MTLLSDDPADGPASDPGAYPTALSGPFHLILPVEGARRIVVFFGAKDLTEGRYNFLQLGREIPATRIFLNNGANDWYQWGIPGLGRSFEESLDSLRRWQAAMDAPEICLIGTSMGGYAAIQYGAALGARVLAFSTDAVLLAPLSRSAIHFTGTGLNSGIPSCPDLRPLIAAGGADVTLFVGEREPGDLYAAQQLCQAGANMGANTGAATGRLRAISIIGSDHYVPTYLSRRSRLGPLIRSFVMGTALPVQSDAGQALDHPDYAAAVYAAQLATDRVDWAEAAAQARLALVAYPHGEAAEMILGWALVKLGQYAEATGLLASALASAPADLEIMHKLAAALRRSGGAARANQLYQLILQQNPGHHASHYALGIMALQNGDLTAAHQAITQALRIAPANPTYRARLRDIAGRMKAERKG